MSGSGQGSERLAALFFFGVVLFNPPLLDLFDSAEIALFGVPLLYAYLFVSWGLLIALTWAVVERAREEAAEPPARADDDAPPGGA